MMEYLHTLTHRMPGVPVHSEAHTAQTKTTRADKVRHNHSHSHSHDHSHGHQVRHRDAEPRVFVGWQRWIASLAPQKRS